LFERLVGQSNIEPCSEKARESEESPSSIVKTSLGGAEFGELLM
jgi:hypothetical protein